MVLEKTLQSPLKCKEMKPVNSKGNQSWIFIGRCWSWNSNNLATWFEELTPWKRHRCWERWKTGGEGDDKGWDSWMASRTWCTWIWTNSVKQWKTEKPSTLQPMGSHRVRHDLPTEQHLWMSTSFTDVSQLLTFTELLLCVSPGLKMLYLDMFILPSQHYQAGPLSRSFSKWNKKL